MKRIYIYFTPGIVQLVKSIVAALFITAFILSTLLSLCYSQEHISQAIKDLSINYKINRPDAILKNFKEGKSKTRIIVNIRDSLGDFKAQKQKGHVGPRHNFRNKSVRRQLKKDVVGAQDIVVNSLDVGNVRVTNRFSYIFGFSAEVTLQGLQALVNNPDVLSVDEDMVLHAHLNQGIPLINGSTVRNTYNGSGLSIAICDTGIDYTHSRLGGGGFPNAKVIGGYDTGQDDSDPMDGNGHGTACAGIAAGDLGTVGDYIGGVAYNAKLYALKMTSTSTKGSAFTSDMVEAWEWCITHQNDDASNPIMIISTSFGGGRYYDQSSCDASSAAMTIAAANAKAAGMTLFVSSGNDGYCDSMEWPGCLSDVISVGAVYDAAFGTYLPCVNAGSCASKTATSGCSTGWYASDNTAADMVTSYSNSDTYLALFAPSNSAYTLGLSDGYNSSFGGTSAACPYAAGAGAALQSAAKAITGSYLTPTALESNLAGNGDLVTDSKVAITKPRVNLGNSIADLGGGGPAVYFSNTTYSGVENGGPITVTVNLGIVSSNTVTVDYASSDGTATAGSDYTAASGILTFNPNETSKTFTVTPINDIDVECNETLTLTLTNPSNSMLGNINQATLHINDDDNISICSSPNLAIPDSNILGVTDSLVVSVSGGLIDLDIYVDVTHAWVGDLIFTLTHVDTGTSVTLIDRPGEPVIGSFGCSGDDIEATLDDEATSPVEDECSTGTPTISGTFKPNNPLSAFDSEDLSGTWTLTVSDNASQDTGALNSWSLLPASDIDSDGIPDQWEILNFGNLTTVDGTTDYDGDGLLDKDEYTANTDPTDIDSENDGMPDGWEITYGLDPLADDSSGDIDGDGISNLQEFIDGTNPTIFDMRIINITRAPGITNDITITWKSVSGLTYEVAFKDDPDPSVAFADPPVYTVTASGNTESWTDNGTLTGSHPSNVQERYYKVMHGGIDSQNIAGMFKITVNDGMNLISLPLVPFSTALEDAIGSQVTGANNEGGSDRLWKWNGTNYEFAWLVAGVGAPYDGQWYTGNSPTAITFGADQGAWVQIRIGNGPKDLYLLGEVAGSNRTISVSTGMNLIGSCYPVPVLLTNTNLWESGLTGADNEGAADRIWSWIGSLYEFIWLVDGVGASYDGKWYMGNTEVNRTLEPGKGYWLQRRDITPFQWDYTKP